MTITEMQAVCYQKIKQIQERQYIIMQCQNEIQAINNEIVELEKQIHDYNTASEYDTPQQDKDSPEA